MSVTYMAVGYRPLNANQEKCLPHCYSTELLNTQSKHDCMRRPPRLLEFARAAVTEFHRLGSFKTDSSQFWSLEIQEEGVSRTVSSEDSLFLYYYFLFMNHMGVDADDKL